MLCEAGSGLFCGGFRWGLFEAWSTVLVGVVGTLVCLRVRHPRLREISLAQSPAALDSKARIQTLFENSPACELDQSFTYPLRCRLRSPTAAALLQEAVGPTEVPPP